MAVKFTVPGDRWYANYLIAGEYSSTPVVSFLIDDVNTALPMIWDRAGKKFMDGRMLPGFIGLTRTYRIEAHYSATQEKLRAALTEFSSVTDGHIDDLIENRVLETYVDMIADKEVRKTLSASLPDSP